jgi:hypothetical protein
MPGKAEPFRTSGGKAAEQTRSIALMQFEFRVQSSAFSLPIGKQTKGSSD